jgi:hypothetical protein
MMRPVKFALKIGGILAAVVAAVIGVAIYTGKLNRPICWQLAQGYRGWVVMKF